jgi:hypothetical protein
MDNTFEIRTAATNTKGEAVRWYLVISYVDGIESRFNFNKNSLLELMTHLNEWEQENIICTPTQE